MSIIGLVASGDSICAQSFGYFYQALGITRFTVTDDDAISIPITASLTFYSAAASVPIITRNMAIPGTRLNTNGFPDLVPLAPLYIDPVIPAFYTSPPFDSSRKYIFTTAIGSNDGALGGYSTAAQYAGAVAQCCVARKQAGYALAAMSTLLPRNDGVMTEPNRTAFNSTITGAGWAAANGIDYIIDLASQTIMGNPANCSNTAYYSDGVHPTALGASLPAPIFLAAVNAMIAML
jgi:hypothetical protein